MAAPSYSELANTPGDPNLAYGTAGIGGTDVVLQPNPAVQALQQYAMLKAQHDANIYKEFQDNVKNYYTNLGTISFKGVLPEDADDLRNRYANLLQQVGNNMGVIRNPMSNPELYGKLTGQIGELKTDIAKSAGHQHFYDRWDALRQTNPQYQTAENDAEYRRTRGQSLNDRQLPTFTPATPFDEGKLIVNAAKNAEVPYAESSVQKGFDPMHPEHPYVITKEGKRYDLQKFDDYVRSGLDVNSNKYGYGLTQGQILDARWKAMVTQDPAVLETYPNAQAFRDWYVKTRRPVGEVITKYSAAADRYGVQAIDLAAAAARQAKQLQQNERHYQQTRADAADKNNTGMEYNQQMNLLLHGLPANTDRLNAAFGGDPITVSYFNKKTGQRTTEKIPSYQVTGNGTDARGNLILIGAEFIPDGKGGGSYERSDRIVPADQLAVAMYNMFGSKSKDDVADKAARYRQFIGMDPVKLDPNQLQGHFGADMSQKVQLEELNPMDYPGKRRQYYLIPNNSNAPRVPYAPVTVPVTPRATQTPAVSAARQNDEKWDTQGYNLSDFQDASTPPANDTKDLD